MEQRHREYLEYYEARLKKFSGTSLYPNMVLTETALRDAIKNAATLEEFKTVLEKENLPFRNAVALMRDQETAWKKHHEETKEVIRAKGNEEVITFLDSVNNLQDLITGSNDVRQKNSLEISADELISEFYGAFTWMENIEVWETADIPSEWKGEVQEWIRESIHDTRDVFFSVTLPAARQLKPDFEFNWDLVWEERHRRKIPVPESVVQNRIEQIRKTLTA